MGVGAGDAVALLARNSSAFIVAQVAISKLGADVLYVNTGFAGPQLGDVLKSEKASAIIADDEFASIVEERRRLDLPRLTAWVDDGERPEGQHRRPGRGGRGQRDAVRCRRPATRAGT